MFGNIKIGISNIIKWAPVIWRDRDWDHAFFLGILKFKLERMERFFRSENAVSRNSVRDADEMKKCLMVLRRITENRYDDIAFGRHDRKWGELEMGFLDGGRIKFSRKNIKTPEDKIKEHKEFEKCMDREKYLRDQDMKYLFSMLAKRLQSWWD